MFWKKSEDEEFMTLIDLERRRSAGRSWNRLPVRMDGRSERSCESQRCSGWLHTSAPRGSENSKGRVGIEEVETAGRTEGFWNAEKSEDHCEDPKSSPE